MTIVNAIGAASPPGQEAALVEHVERLASQRAGRMGAHLRLSKLKPLGRRENNARIASSALNTLLKPFSGEIFVLNNSDIVFLCYRAKPNDLEKILANVLSLLGDDVLPQKTGGRKDELYALYDIWGEYPAFLALTRKLLAEEKLRLEDPLLSKGKDHGGAKSHRQPITPQSLHRFETMLARSDIAALLHRQPICAVVGDRRPEPVFKELYVSIAELQQALAPNTDLAANRWLFGYVTGLLDKRVLKLLRRNIDSSLKSHYSLNLNVATVFSEEFSAFDSGLPTGARGTIVIELQPMDIIADLRSYALAREYLRERGYRLCVDGLNLDMLRFIDRERLRADLLKIYWNSDFAEEHNDELRAEVGELIRATGPARVILCRCDNKDAIRCGASMGISLFQGRHIDTLLQQTAGGVVRAEAAAAAS
jgi:hypothetical protein